MEHPRWGLIQGVHALRDIAAGEEVFVDYGYKVADFPSDFKWYHQAKKAMLREQKEEARRRQEEEKNTKRSKKKSGCKDAHSDNTCKSKKKERESDKSQT